MLTEKNNFTIFNWKGSSRTGVTIKGMIPAESIEHAETQLAAQGIEIKQLRKAPSWQLWGQLNKINLADIVMLIRQLATLISAAVPLVTALEIVANGFDKIGVKQLIMQIHKDVSGGCPFAEAIAKHPKFFNKLVCSLIAAGEKSGNLDVVLEHIAKYLERMQVLHGRVKKAMMYPTIMVVVMIAVGILLLGFIVPQFEGMFKSFGAQLPGPTLVIMKLSHALQHYWWAALLALSSLFFLYYYLKKNSYRFNFFLAQFQLKLPILGVLLEKAVLARVTKTLAIMLGAGIPLVEGLKNAASVSNNLIYEKALMQISEQVTTGKQLYASMHATMLFPNIMLQLVGIGEKSGQMEIMLNKVSEYYEEEVNTAVDGLSTLLEPILLLMLGVVIGGFVISMYLPIFKLGSVM